MKEQKLYIILKIWYNKPVKLVEGVEISYGIRQIQGLLGWPEGRQTVN